MNKWISTLDKNGNPKDMRSPDGTIIEIYEDKNIIITPNGYRVLINLWPPSFEVLDCIDNHKGKIVYDKLFNATKKEGDV